MKKENKLLLAQLVTRPELKKILLKGKPTKKSWKKLAKGTNNIIELLNLLDPEWILHNIFQINKHVSLHWVIAPNTYNEILWRFLIALCVERRKDILGKMYKEPKWYKSNKKSLNEYLKNENKIKPDLKKKVNNPPWD